MKRLCVVTLVFFFVFINVRVLFAAEKKQIVRPVTEQLLSSDVWGWETKDILFIYKFWPDHTLIIKMHRKGMDKAGEFSGKASFWWRIDEERNTLSFYSFQGAREWTFDYCSPCFVSKVKMKGDKIEVEIIEGIESVGKLEKGDIKIFLRFKE